MIETLYGIGRALSNKIGPTELVNIASNMATSVISVASATVFTAF